MDSPYANASAPYEKAPAAIATPKPQTTIPPNQDDIDKEIGKSLRHKRLRRRTFLHKVFIGINAVTFLTALNMICGQIMGMVIQQNYPMEYLVRLYTVGLCVIVMLNEVELTRYTQQSLVLRNWICRGILYNFVGALGLVEDDIGNDNYMNRKNGFGRYAPTREDIAEMYMKLSAWIMFAVGMLYIIMGVLCIQSVFNRVREDYHNRMEQWKQEDEAEKRARLRGELGQGRAPKGLCGTFV